MNITNNIELNQQIKSVDLYICSASFENRCLAFTESISKDSINSVAIFYNNDELNCFDNNLQALLQQWGEKANSIPVRYKDASNIADVFSVFFKKNFSSKRGKILLDCTTFTHEGLLIILKYLNEYKSSYEELNIIYNCAEDYSTNTVNVNEKWLTKGIKSIKTVLGYPGTSNPSKKNHLIILFGFELDRTIKLIDQMDFDEITLCFGSETDSIKTDHYILNKKRHEELLSLYPNAKKLEISLRNPEKTKQILLDYIKDDSNNIVIAPMNNKISTIGVALATIDNPNIQIIYSKANEYNITGYSRCSSEFILFKI